MCHKGVNILKVFFQSFLVFFGVLGFYRFPFYQVRSLFKCVPQEDTDIAGLGPVDVWLHTYEMVQLLKLSNLIHV